METKLVRIAEISATTKHPIFTSVYHLINEDMLKQCHKELDGSKAVGIDKVTKDEYGKNLDRNIKDLVQRLKNKSFKPLPSLRVYIPKANGKKRPLGIASYEDKICTDSKTSDWTRPMIVLSKKLVCCTHYLICNVGQILQLSLPGEMK